MLITSKSSLTGGWSMMSVKNDNGGAAVAACICLWDYLVALELAKTVFGSC